MKFFESHYEDYLHAAANVNLHPKLNKVLSRFPPDLRNLGNIIIYGPKGVGKYTQMLNAIRRYSASDLKYDKKISVIHNKTQYVFRISDIHYEVDMSLLGCNSKLLWHEIYNQLIDSMSAKSHKSGIIVCKHFQEIHSELLETFYSYMQKNTSLSVSIKFILITEAVSFIPDSILSCCQVINLGRPSRATYSKCIKRTLKKTVALEHISNIKNLHMEDGDTLMQPYKITCSKIVGMIMSVEDFKFIKFRELLYDLFIYDMNVSECVWAIILELIAVKAFPINRFQDVLTHTYRFFKGYNNNYRPIYHVEKFLLTIACLIHGCESIII